MKKRYHPSRRAVLRTLGGAAAGGGLAGCLGVLDEDARDWNLHRSNWLTPSNIEYGIASGYAEPYNLYNQVKMMEEVTWPEFVSWLSVPATRIDEQKRLPVILEEVISGNRPFAVGLEGKKSPSSRDIPAMSAVTIDKTGEPTDQRHLAVFELPESTSRSKLKEILKNISGGDGREVNGMTVFDWWMREPSQLHVVFVLKDGLLLIGVGSNVEWVGSKSKHYLQETLERAGTEYDLTDQPVRHVEEMDVVTTYGPAFIEDDETAPSSQSVGIDLESQTKTVVLSFPDPGRATQTGDRFSVENGTVRFATDDGVSRFTPLSVKYQTIRQEGKVLIFEGNIPDLAGTIQGGPPTWSYGIVDR